MSDLVLTEHRDHIVELILNRPEKRNAINWAVMQALDAAITEAGQLPGVRVILLRGEGKGFSSGIDLAAFGQISKDFGPGWRENLLPFTQAFQAVFNRLERSPLPVIALLHNYALGLGLELALACDLRIAAEGTRLALPEARMGIIPDVGGTTRLTRLVGPARAKELIMTGRNIDLDEAERWGIVNAVVPETELMDKAEALAGEIAGSAPLAVSYAKRVIDGLYDTDRGLQLEAFAQSHLIKTGDFETGAQAMLTKQPPEWKGQ